MLKSYIAIEVILYLFIMSCFNHASFASFLPGDVWQCLGTAVIVR